MHRTWSWWQPTTSSPSTTSPTCSTTTPCTAGTRTTSPPPMTLWTSAGARSGCSARRTRPVVDGPHKKVRRGRAAAANLVPTSTGAAKATTKVLTQLDGHFDGLAVRAPVVVGSIADIVMLTDRNTSADEVNAIFEEEAKSDRYHGIMGAVHDPLVSSDATRVNLQSTLTEACPHPMPERVRRGIPRYGERSPGQPAFPGRL